jgi:RNA polymerase sigma factor (sigma-70 family)
MDGKRRSAAVRPREEDRRHSCRPEEVMQLLRRTQEGDTSAEHQLHAVFRPMVASAVIPYLGNPGIAEELTGVSYLILHRLLFHFDPSRGVNLFTYLQKMLPRHLASFVRREHRARDRELPLSALSVAPSEDDEDTDVEAALALLMPHDCGWQQQRSQVEEVVVLNLTITAAVEKLSDRQQQVFELWMARHSVAGMAEELEMTPAATRQAWHRVKLALQEALKKVP